MKRMLIITALMLFFTVNCGDRALFDELAENRVKVIIKGTFESNNPRDWVTDFPEDDSVDDLKQPAEDMDPTIFMLDIAEMRITDGHLDQKFANYRKTYSFGLDSNNDFFNGNGVYFENDDMRPDFVWQHVNVYIRKMLFDKAMIYSFDNDDNDDNDDNMFNGTGKWNFVEEKQEIFAEEDTAGLNFNLFQVQGYYDTLRLETGSLNRIFPLSVKIEDNFVFNNDIESTVLEIRMVIKNFVKKYEHDEIEDSVHVVEHFYALSDWLRDVKDEGYNRDGNFVSESAIMGGNLIATARSYIPGQTVTLRGSAGFSDCYVIAIKEGHDIGNYQISETERLRPECDEPKRPYLEISDDFEYLLDYYLKMQKYKDDFDEFVTCVDTTDDAYGGESEYESTWTTYNDNVSDFKIPALVTWTDSGEFEITNVPVGHGYKIYRSSCAGDCNANELPGSYIRIVNGLINVTADQAGQIIDVN